MNDKQLESILHEDRVFPPAASFSDAARIDESRLAALHAEAEADHEAYWARMARELLTWDKDFTVTLDESEAPNYRWFTDGELNVSRQCLDVHLDERGDKTAIVFEGEGGDKRRISYRQLTADVCRFANALKARGIQAGDRVVIYMPMVPEAVVAMQACARIGAIHSVVFGGFSANSLRDRIQDAGAKMVITADGGHRGGQIVELKEATDRAVEQGCDTIETVIVLRRADSGCEMQAGRDIWWADAIAEQSDECPAVPLNAEHPLFLLYTSGSTGKPKGIQHSSAGYLLHAKLTNLWVFDLREDDVFWCTADVGWITGHTYVAYGPLAAGATIVMYEGAPTYPDAGRFWSICQRHGVTVFYTAPTAIRALMKFGDDVPAQYDLSKIRLLGTVGEPINPEAWMWYHQTIGKERCPIVDTWWQTETGGIMISPLPGATATKPGSCTRALPGIAVDIVDEAGNSVTQADAGGYLVIRKPWPSMLRTIWGDNDRYIETYWERFQNRFYVAGDSTHRDAEGNFWIMGRIDDVLNVSGHRLGTMEVESALVSHDLVAEAAVVGRPDPTTGEAISAFVVLKGDRPVGEAGLQLAAKLRDWVA
ncbi:MAG: acetate--CoA ligase, partial [Gammaproteobacteria bacterium]